MSNVKALMLAELQRFQTNGVDDKNYGLCSNVAWAVSGDIGQDYDLQGECHDVMKGLCLSWPESSGDAEYPVPHNEYSAKGAYDSRELYVGAYGAARYRLLDYCVKTLEAELR